MGSEPKLLLPGFQEQIKHSKSLLFRDYTPLHLRTNSTHYLVQYVLELGAVNSEGLTYMFLFPTLCSVTVDWTSGIGYGGAIRACKTENILWGPFSQKADCNSTSYTIPGSRIKYIIDTCYKRYIDNCYSNSFNRDVYQISIVIIRFQKSFLLIRSTLHLKDTLQTAFTHTIQPSLHLCKNNSQYF